MVTDGRGGDTRDTPAEQGVGIVVRTVRTIDVAAYGAGEYGT